LEARLLVCYSCQQAMPVLVKLQNCIANLNFNTHKKSIAVFISPVYEKVIYLDIEVQENMMVDEEFNLGQIARFKKEDRQFLLLWLTTESSHLYLGNENKLQLIMLNKSLSMNGADPASSVADIRNFTNFLVQVDNGLSIVLKTHPYPVFIVGSSKMIEWYKSATQNDEHISRAIQQPHPAPSDEMLHQLIAPYFSSWKNIQQQKLVKQLNKAHLDGSLVTGFGTVAAAIKQRGWRLVVEEPVNEDVWSPNEETAVNRPVTKPFYLRSFVDEIAEKVLECGGDIEVLPPGALSRYQHIAYLHP